MIDWVKQNQRWIVAGALAWVAAAEFGYTIYPWEIEGSGVAATAAVVAGIAGYGAAGKIWDLLPDEEGIYLVAFEASDETGGAIYELTTDQFGNMEVETGSLFEWPVAKRVYEVREYRPEENVAVGNWRESVAGSELAGEAMVVDALEAITELRDEFEPEAQKARYLQRRIRSIARRQDRERLRDQQDILDPTVAPTFDEEAKTISQIVEEEIPDDLQPDKVATGPDATNDEETVGFEFDPLDENEDPLQQANE